MKKLLVMTFASLGALASLAATDARSVAPGGTFEIAASEKFAKTQGSTSNINILYFEGDGTLKITGSGATCMSGFAIYATNGTLTVDLSEFTFADSSKKIFWPAGGLRCDNQGKLDLTGSGVTELWLGASGSSDAYYALRDNVLVDGAAVLVTNRASLAEMPSRSTVPWTFAKMAWLGAVGVDMSELCDGTGTLTSLPAPFVRAGYVESFEEVTKVCIAKGQKMETFLCGLYNGVEITLSDKTKTKIFSPYNWGGRTGRVFTPNVELLDKSAQLLQSLRGIRFAGTVTGPGALVIAGTKVTSKTTSDWTIFSNTVNVASLLVRGDTVNGTGFQQVRFTEPCTVGSLTFYDDTTANCTTNIRLRVEKSLTVTGNTCLSTASASGDIPYKDKAQILLEKAGATVSLGTVTNGVASVRTGGTLVFAELGESAALYVHPEVSVASSAPGVYREMTVDDPKAGTVVRVYQGVVELGELTEPTALHGPGPVTLRASTKESVEPVSLDGTAARVVTNGSGWNDNENIMAWFDFSDDASLHQVTATTNPPTCVQATYAPPLLEEGQKLTTYADNAHRPVVEWVTDCRGGIYTNRLYNARMYQNLAKTGTNEFWSGVYPYRMTNASELVNGLTYLSWGTESSGRRIDFAPYLSRPRSITYVFNVQNGGGMNPIRDSKGYFGREQGAASAILSNDTCDVWVNGAKVADPTQETYPEGWCVVTMQPKAGYQDAELRSIGMRTEPTCGQMFGELVVMKDVPTDGQRTELEARLATKWGITNVTLQVSRVAVTGSGTLEFAGDVTLTSDTVGANLTYAGSGDLILKSRDALPGAFADTYDGEVVLDFPSLYFTLSGTTVENPIVMPAKLRQTRPMEILLDGTGSGTLDLITCGGFLGATSWTLSESGRGKLNQTPTKLQLIGTSGAVFYIR